MDADLVVLKSFFRLAFSVVVCILFYCVIVYQQLHCVNLIVDSVLFELKRRYPFTLQKDIYFSFKWLC